MASKLIFSKSWEQLAKQFSSWNQGANDNPIYYSIAFTDDGYLATHGKRFKLTNADGDDGAGGALSLAGNVLTFTDSLGIGHNVTLPLIQAKGVDGNPVSVSTADSVATIQLDKITGLADSASFGSTTTTSISIPKITVDAYGRITAAQTATAVSVDKITQTAVSGETSKYYLLGRNQQVAEATKLSDSVYNKEVWYNGTALSAPALAEGSTLLQDKYVKLADAFQKSGDAYQFLADDTHHGVVYLSDNYESTVANTAASSTAVRSALTAAKAYSDGLFAANDAMVFAGTIDNAGNLVSKNASLGIQETAIVNVTGKSGWTFKFEGSGTISINGVNHNYEAGDMLVCTSDDKKLSQGGWTIVQANIDGAVTAANAFAGSGLVVSTGAGRSVDLFSYPAGTTAKILKATSAGLSWADDIDTHRQVKVGSTVVCASDDVTTALNFVQGAGIEIVGATDGTVTIKNTSALSSALSLSILANNGDSVGSYNPYDTALSLKAGAGLEAALVEGNVVFKHSNSITAQTTPKLGSIKFDAQGHITGFTEVTSLKNPNALTIGDSTNKIAYDGSTAMTLDIVGSGDLSITKTATAAGITYNGSLTHKYKAISIKNGVETQATPISGNTVSAITLVGGNNITLSKDGESNIKIAATNTWRNVSAYTLTGNASSEVLSSSSVGTADLAFGSEFVWNADANSASGEIKLVWTEIDESGNISYQA